MTSIKHEKDNQYCKCNECSHAKDSERLVEFDDER